MVFFQLDACMVCGLTKGKKLIAWSPLEVLEFNVDVAPRGKPGQEGIGVLRNYSGGVLTMFSKHVGVRNSNEVEVMAILETIWIYSASFQRC